MRRLPLRFTVLALGGVGVAAGLLAVLGTQAAPGALKRAAAINHSASSKVSVIAVTAGKPSELAFKLSKTSMVPAGTITFKVTNMGVAFHNFKVCTIPVPSAAGAKNICFGKGTPILKHGQSATLTVSLSLAGKYEFLCTVTGHAAAGMKGLLGVGVHLGNHSRWPAVWELRNDLLVHAKLYRRIIMPRGDKSSYTDKQQRQAEHIEEGYEHRGVSEHEAERRAWATVNKATGGVLRT